jgi:bifunctional non-homologous end joining protein LigD
MFRSFDFCLPSRASTVPQTPDWLHEIKYDGYRLRVERNGDRVRLITGGGYNSRDRFPWIVEAALKNRQKQFVIDGEAVILGVDGISDFNALHSGRHNEEVQLCAFDVLAMDGDDLRDLPLSIRKANLVRLLARRPKWDISQRIRTGRDRPRSVSRSLPDGIRGLGVEASRPALSGWPVEALGEDQEPVASGDQPGYGLVRLNGNT